MEPLYGQRAESAHDVLRRRSHPLSALFAPGRVAVIGASETPGSVGRTVLKNLIDNPFGGTVFPVNPHHASVLGVKAYPTIGAVPDPIDLAVIITPAATVPGLIEECVDAGVKGSIVMSAGFRETGAQGAALEARLLGALRRGAMRLVGPNCLGVMNPLTGLNATFANAMARPGHVAFVSQSGALCTAILDWSLREEFGFSAFVSIGSMLDVGWGDLIDYLGGDPNTESIVIYMESIGDARSFLSAAREVALTKPIIVIKAGRTDAAAKAAASHTGALTGRDEVVEAALRRCGVLRVHHIAHLFYMAEVLAKQPRPPGPRLTILTNAGGPGILATDTLIPGEGLLADLSPETLEALNRLLPPQWSHHNPIDILGDATPERYARAVEIAAKDPNSDGLLVILTPQAMTDPTRTAEALAPHARHARLTGKPILASWMGGGGVADGERILNRADIPTFAYPDTAVRVFNYMWQYAKNLSDLYETPALSDGAETDSIDPAEAGGIIERARAAGRTLLTEAESKALLAAYAIPVVETHVADGESAAVTWADRVGYPVALKLHSNTLTHKSDVGGVRLGLRDDAEVRRAYRAIEASVTAKAGAGRFQGVTVQPMAALDGGYEVIIGSSLDPEFGPVLMFGAGGQLAEVFSDRSLDLPPLTTTLAHRMIERTRIATALKGVRGRRPVDLASLERLMVRFSRLVMEQRGIREIEINPLLISADRLIALDARAILHAPDSEEAALPRPAIRPYPRQYLSPWTLRDGTGVTIRPIRPEDEPLMVTFYETVSGQSVYSPYFATLQLTPSSAHERLTRICFIDYDREMALVAERREPASDRRTMLAIARLSRVHGSNEAEFSLLVDQRCQRLGLGTELLRRLVQVGRDERLDRITAEIDVQNQGMQRICRSLGFQFQAVPKRGVVRAELPVQGAVENAVHTPGGA
ncbi:MAG TPA: bifunctional acetate--CoA ligase family protein/GNAT family N-acetyltransferase [Nitrospiria bacterium]|nr:bifunctional acetate--CoA ligase family protein/GNAT family N-acetyltransferase [Nitrospiria bacterium]